MHMLFGGPTRRGCRRDCGGTAHAGFKLDPLEQALHNRQPLDCSSWSITAIEASVGDSYDNALAETINGLHKAEVIRRREPWRSFEAVEFATLKWVDWFNNRRLMEPIGNIPPAEAEERYYALLDDKLAA